ncbi:DUF6555 family protein [Pseudomonas sp. NA-150]|uniref:DUF6555 family protein n=1 Tax=Pseudomonas sp. NA-150 TaxID=3367525 RepID=UPI0037CBC594
MSKDAEVVFEWRAMDELNTYEIHYVFHGAKKVMLHRAKCMTDCDAWVIAAVEVGVPLSALPTVHFRTVIITAAESQGVSKVRWNLCPRTRRFDTP